jgi:hypothetical protein
MGFKNLTYMSLHLQMKKQRGHWPIVAQQSKASIKNITQDSYALENNLGLIEGF